MVTYQSIVKGATKIKLAPPKEKYLTPILIGCSSQSSSSKDTQDILYLLHKRLKDSAFTICYKSLIVLHYILNECNNSNNNMLLTNVYNEFLDYKSGNGSHDYYCRASESDLLALKRYKEYLFTRINLSYNENDKKDLVDPGFLEILKKNNSINNDSKSNSSEKIPIDQIIKIIKLQIECISKLLKNKYSLHDLSNTNDLLTTCFRLLTNDLLVLYNILNEGIITILESFFELNIQLQRETCQLYDEFVDITEDVVKYLKVGKQCGLRIPVIKHITTKLGKSLREHVESPENVNNASKKTSAKEQLEAIRKQRQILESQLRMTSNNLTSPVAAQTTQFSSFPTNLQPQATAQVPIQTGTNPFLVGNQGGFVHQQATQQVTQPNNGFVQQQATQPNNGFLQPQATQPNNGFLQQQATQPNNGFLQQPQATITTNLVQQHTTNPFFTASPTIETNKPIQGKSLNPFSMENVQKENLKRQQTNPFSLSNQPEVENRLVNNNPFGIEKEGAVFGNVQHTGFAQQANYQQQNYQQGNYQQQSYQNNPNQGFSLIDL
ncbi:uncharacterized protein HGUI_00746 [Hanseniaspora guilliermondii]|uniref:ENTH domain-containing protein n=1 Tax=Hanseniaspora guilliermondii TaxID=56406 RepID=A0A1L0AVY0_9ASCO|nr:uncharacterized protein HGUI_00746 [Hanseniaspora guilliermondii]